MSHLFCADLHLGHSNILAHDQAPFATVKEREDAIYAALDSVLTPGDTLWNLGDVAWYESSLRRYIGFLRDREVSPVLVRGNHDDKAAWKFRDLFDASYEATYQMFTVDGKQVGVYLSHYAHRTWRNSGRGSYHFYGHSHGKLPDFGRSTDVGVKPRNYTIPSLNELIKELGDRPFGLNLQIDGTGGRSNLGDDP